jgi:hypothetical protein
MGEGEFCFMERNRRATVKACGDQRGFVTNLELLFGYLIQRMDFLQTEMKNRERERRGEKEKKKRESA